MPDQPDPDRTGSGQHASGRSGSDQSISQHTISSEPEESLAPRRALDRVRAAGRAPARRRARRSRPDAGGSRDPAPLGELVDTLVDAQGWRTEVAVGSLVARWPDIVGAEFAAHCVPEDFTDGALRIRTDSTAWATQVRLLTPQLMARLEAIVGPGVVEAVTVLPPQAPSWKRGRKSVPGRGPRDTYG